MDHVQCQWRHINLDLLLLIELLEFPINCWHTINASIELANVTVPEEALLVQTDLVTSVAIDVVLAKLVNRWDASGNLDWMLVFAFRAVPTNFVVAFGMSARVMAAVLGGLADLTNELTHSLPHINQFVTLIARSFTQFCRRFSKSFLSLINCTYSENNRPGSVALIT